MALVDFSNAIIEPDPTRSSCPLYAMATNINLENLYFFDSSGNQIGNGECTVVVMDKYNLSLVYTGTFSASGTEFYMGTLGSGWKVSNISFSNGDKYDFQVNVTLTCN